MIEFLTDGDVKQDLAVLRAAQKPTRELFKFNNRKNLTYALPRHHPLIERLLNDRQDLNMVNPTVRPANPFNPTEDAEALKQAFKGFGTDEKKVIEILAKRSNEQRQEIAKRFKTMYGKDLIDELKSELRGNFEDLVVALMYPTVDYYAKQIHKAISGAGTDEEALIEILGVHTNDEIKDIREAYETKYGPLEDDIKSDTSGTLKRLFVSLITACRDESGVTDTEKAHQDAQTLLRAGELFAGTDESTFNQILCQRNKEQLKLIFADYQNITGHGFEEAIENEFSGATKRVLIALVKCIKDKIDFLAERLHSSMDRIGTDDTTLIRIIVTRSEIDLEDIKAKFQEKYGKSLAEFIRGDTSGDYKHCLLAVAGEE